MTSGCVRALVHESRKLKAHWFSVSDKRILSTPNPITRTLRPSTLRLSYDSHKGFMVRVGDTEILFLALAGSCGPLESH